MKKKRVAAPNYHVPALEKSLDILEALALTPIPQSLADLGRTLNRTSSELFRMLTVLERRAYVVKEPLSGNYSLSMRLYELGHTHSPVEQVIKAASRPMRELADRVKESCHLSILSRDKLIVLLQMESPEKLRLSIEVGAQFSPIHTNSGRLLLASLPEADLRAFLSLDSDYARSTRKEKDALSEDLGRIRRTGCSISSSETRMGMKDIAVLVGNPNVGVSAALAIPCLLGGRDEADVKRLTAELKSCAEHITRTLGLTPSVPDKSKV